jgi:hypothetical protein
MSNFDRLRLSSVSPIESKLDITPHNSESTRTIRSIVEFCWNSRIRGGEQQGKLKAKKPHANSTHLFSQGVRIKTARISGVFDRFCLEKGAIFGLLLADSPENPGQF